MAPTTLLGPPEIYQTVAAAAAAAAPASGDPFVDLLVANYNNTVAQKKPPMGKTRHNSRTFLSTGNPCLDFFFHVVPKTPAEDLNMLLEGAWGQDPLKALKLVHNLGGVRGTGKSDKEGFYAAAMWLHKNHPKTLASNVVSFAEAGYFKDLMEILFRLLDGDDARSRKRKRELRRRKNSGYSDESSDYSSESTYCDESSDYSSESSDESSDYSSESPRTVTKVVRNSKYSDPNFKFLDEWSDLFAQFLRADMKLLDSGDLGKISTAAKWCSSLDSESDRVTLLCEAIGKKVFPREEYPEYEDVKEAHYAHRVTLRLRKQVLVPLLKATQSGESKIASGALLPHEIIAALRHDPLAELQWKRMVEDMGRMKNCVAICDVSTSVPKEVSLALGVLVSELSEGPWKGKLFTFSDKPKLHLIQGKILREKMACVKRIKRNYKQNLYKVFDILLKVAVQGKVRREEMVKRVFVFSDMQFGTSSSHDETGYEEIERKFSENGYTGCVPEMVFWNLSDSSATPDNHYHSGQLPSKATPVVRNQSGVALVSGYSKNLMSLLMEKYDIGATMNPEAVMEAAIAGDEYRKLIVVD